MILSSEVRDGNWAGNVPAGGYGSFASSVTNMQVDYVRVYAGVPGDYNNNGAVDAADYVLWRKGGPLANEVDLLGTVNGTDYAAWRARFGNSSGGGNGTGASANTTVPETAAYASPLFAAACWYLRRRSAALKAPASHQQIGLLKNPAICETNHSTSSRIYHNSVAATLRRAEIPHKALQ